MEEMRLQKFLSAQGLMSRRAAEQETADPYTAPRKEEPKRTLEDDYLDFMNRYK